jgi:hypothetical protein
MVSVHGCSPAPNSIVPVHVPAMDATLAMGVAVPDERAEAHAVTASATMVSAAR